MVGRRVRTLAIALAIVFGLSLLHRHQYSDGGLATSWGFRLGASSELAPGFSPSTHNDDPKTMLGPDDPDELEPPPAHDVNPPDKTTESDLKHDKVEPVLPTEVEHAEPVEPAEHAGPVPEGAHGSADEPQKPTVAQTPPADDVDWSRFAYTQYVTNKKYLCNSVMLFETLQRLGSKANRVMMYPSYMLPDPTSKEGESREAKLIITARDSYGVELAPIQIQHREERDDTWADSFTKLLAFNQTQYERVLALDSDSVVLQPMDELFLTPPCPVAMPRAYWLLRDDPPRRVLSSQLVLLQPSAIEFERIQAQTEASGTDDYDMEIVNQLYLDSATVLPHRPYDLLTGEFRSEDHRAYLGSDREEWDPVAVLKEAKFLHFSDWPMPKPWEHISESVRQKAMPKCQEKNGKRDCTSRDIWNKIYDDFRKHRDEICIDPFMSETTKV